MDCIGSAQSSGIDVCGEPMKFNTSTFGARFVNEKNLVPGWGCWLNMTRYVNGSWGTLTVIPTDEEAGNNLLIFDPEVTADDKLDATVPITEYKTGMKYTDKGWIPRSVFIVNRSMRNYASFQYIYEGGVALSVASLSMFALLSVALQM